MKKKILIPLFFLAVFIGTEAAHALSWQWWSSLSSRFTTQWLTDDFWRDGFLDDSPQAFD